VALVGERGWQNKAPLKAGRRELLNTKSVLKPLLMIITLSRGPKGATQAPVLHPCPLKEFGAKSNQFLITLNLAKRIESALFPERGGVVRGLDLTKRIESFTVHVARFKRLGISQRELKLLILPHLHF